MRFGRKRNFQVINFIINMEHIQHKWQTRINSAEAKPASSFQFSNKKFPFVIVGTN